MTDEKYTREISRVEGAINELSHWIKDVAMNPKNVAKGGWDELTPSDLVTFLTEEVGEVAKSLRRGDSYEVVAREIGDAAWVLGMLLDRFKTLVLGDELVRLVPRRYPNETAADEGNSIDLGEVVVRDVPDDVHAVFLLMCAGYPGTPDGVLLSRRASEAAGWASARIAELEKQLALKEGALNTGAMHMSVMRDPMSSQFRTEQENITKVFVKHGCLDTNHKPSDVMDSLLQERAQYKQELDELCAGLMAAAKSVSYVPEHVTEGADLVKILVAEVKRWVTRVQYLEETLSGVRTLIK